jgi:D-3-phosphoglycerate dehydrogenase
MKILHLEQFQYPRETLNLLQENHEIYFFECNSQESLYKHLKTQKYNAIFTRLGLNIDRKCIELQKETLKYIITPTTGLNHIDTDYASELSVLILSLKGEVDFLSNVKSTAEHTWGLLLMLIRNLKDATESVKCFKWGRQNFLSDELSEKCLGIIGYGRLGKIIARYGVAFGMKVKVFDINKNAVNNLPLGIEYFDLYEVLSKSDFIVLLINYEIENIKFIGKTEFEKMKFGAYFINTSRGELVDETALLDSLNSGKLKGAALDVLHGDSTWTEKIDTDNILVRYAAQNNNLIITPHIGGYGINSIYKTRKFITQKFFNSI